MMYPVAPQLDELNPYGELIATRVRVVTWNVWGRVGPWRERQPVIADVLAAAGADLVALQESWTAEDGTGQAAELGDRLGLPYHATSASTGVAASGTAVLSRWPITATATYRLPGRDHEPGVALAAEIDGPRGPIALVSAMTGSFRPGQSADRQDQVRALAGHVAELPRRAVKIVGADLNAPPDSDEVRMLTGRAAVPVPGLVFYDAWEIAGDGPGHTWTSANPWAATALLPNRRVDYVLTPWPRRGGQGHPLHAELIGTDRTDPVPSDHYGVLAELRY